MTLCESMRCGRSKLVYSIVTGCGVPRVMTVASNRVPTPIGPSVTLVAAVMVGL